MVPHMRVVLGCRHALFREGLREILKRWNGIDVVGTAPSLAEVPRLVDREQPDALVLVRTDSPRDDAQTIETTKKLAPKCVVVLVESGGRSGTRESLGETARVTRSVGATGLVRLLWELSGEANGRETDPRDLGPEPRQLLTEREWDVARAVCEGLPNKTIARKLRISEKTVKNHLSSIYRRAEISGRTQLAVWAMKRGLDGEDA